MKKRVAVVIPAYNESGSIATVVNNILGFSYKDYEFVPIVVNDASTDDTAQIATGLPCILLNLPVNLGIGGAVQTGFRYAWDNGFDFAIQVDGDGQHPASEIEHLIKGWENTGHDVIIGSRFIDFKGFQSTRWRRMGIVYFRWLIGLFCGIRITDCTSGFRLFNRQALAVAQAKYPDDYPEPESLVLFRFSGLQISEVAVVMNERIGGVSSIGFFASFYYLAKVSIAIFLTYIRVTNTRKKWKT